MDDQVNPTQQNDPIVNLQVSRIQSRLNTSIIWKQNPSMVLWFKQIKSQFVNSNIIHDVTKYYTVVEIHLKLIFTIRLKQV